MKTISTQFHAHPEEMVQFVSDIIEKFPNLCIIYRTIIPAFSIKEIRLENVKETIFSPQRQQYSGLIFFIKHPNLNAKNQMSFYDINPEYIVLDIGRLTETGLEESVLAVRGDDEIYRLGQRIVRILKNRTISSPVSFNPQTGAAGIAKTHRYTIGAKKLYEEGICILPFAGGCLFKLEKCN